MPYFAGPEHVTVPTLSTVAPATSIALAAFGDNVTRARKARSLSRAELADKIGSSAPVVGRYERAEMTPSVEIAAKLADALGVSLDYLTGRTSAAATADDEALRRLEAIAQLPTERRRELFNVVDAYLRDFHTAKAYAV